MRFIGQDDNAGRVRTQSSRIFRQTNRKFHGIKTTRMPAWPDAAACQDFGSADWFAKGMAAKDGVATTEMRFYLSGGRRAERSAALGPGFR